MEFEAKAYRWKWARVVDRAKSEWARMFAADIARRLKCDNWTPTAKQFDIMETLCEAYQADHPSHGEERRFPDGTLRRFDPFNGWCRVIE